MKTEERIWRNRVTRIEFVKDKMEDQSAQHLFKDEVGKYYIVLDPVKGKDRLPEERVFLLEPEAAAKWLIVNGYDLPADLEIYLEENEQ